MTILDALILGVVEGVTEYLPVSSTGHLILTGALLGLGRPEDGETSAAAMGAVKEALDRFEIAIQGGAILAVAGLYWPRLMQMAAGLLSLVRPGSRTERSADGLRLLRNLVVSFIPAAVVGLTLEPLIKRHLFHPVPVIVALMAGGLLLLALGPWQRRRGTATAERASGPDPLASLSVWRALVIGLAQTLALWPGTSRSMVTILAALGVGLPPRKAAEYSFLLGLPTLAAASAWQIAKVLRGQKAPDGTVLVPGGMEGLHRFVELIGGWGPLLVGLAAATVTAALAVRWLVGWLGRHSLDVFGWWRLLVAAAFAWALALGWIAH